MKDTATIAQMTIRILGTIMIVLGVLIWTGHFDSLIALHRLFGFVLVIALWTLAYLVYTSGANQGPAIAAFLWGLLAPILGLTQENILTGNGHWVIQILHLLIGLGLIGLGERLGMLIKASRPSTAPAAS